MIAGVHALIYADDAETARAFLRDVLDLDSVDAHDGWLIFEMPEADMGCHPTDTSGHSGDKTPPAGTQAVSFYCDDIEQTVTV